MQTDSKLTENNIDEIIVFLFVENSSSIDELNFCNDCLGLNEKNIMY